MRKKIEKLYEGENNEEFMEKKKIEMFKDKVLWLKKKGRMIEMKRGEKNIDFEYEVKKDIGERWVGEKVNGRIMKLMKEIKNGEEVDIIR